MRDREPTPMLAARWDVLPGALTLRLHYPNRDTPVVHSIPKGAEYSVGMGDKKVYQWHQDGAFHLVVVNMRDVVSSYAIQEDQTND